MAEFKKINVVRIGGRLYMLLPNTLRTLPAEVRGKTKVFEPTSCGANPDSPPAGVVRGLRDIGHKPTCYREVQGQGAKGKYIGVPRDRRLILAMRQAFATSSKSSPIKPAATTPPTGPSPKGSKSLGKPGVAFKYKPKKYTLDFTLQGFTNYGFLPLGEEVVSRQFNGGLMLELASKLKLKDKLFLYGRLRGGLWYSHDMTGGGPYMDHLRSPVGPVIDGDVDLRWAAKPRHHFRLKINGEYGYNMAAHSMYGGQRFDSSINTADILPAMFTGQIGYQGDWGRGFFVDIFAGGKYNNLVTEGSGVIGNIDIKWDPDIKSKWLKKIRLGFRFEQPSEVDTLPIYLLGVVGLSGQFAKYWGYSLDLGYQSENTVAQWSGFVAGAGINYSPRNIVLRNIALSAQTQIPFNIITLPSYQSYLGINGIHPLALDISLNANMEYRKGRFRWFAEPSFSAKLGVAAIGRDLDNQDADFLREASRAKYLGASLLTGFAYDRLSIYLYGYYFNDVGDYSCDDAVCREARAMEKQIWAAGIMAKYTFSLY